jgi:hypothetical protein
MTIDNKISTKSQQIGLKSFFPLINIDKGSIENKKEKNVVTILIQRRSSNSDIWICNSCTLTGDRWFMEKHPCRQNISNNFAKVAQRLQQQKEFS